MKDIYTLENETLRIKVTSLGATLMSLYDKKKELELVLGFDSVDDYIVNRTTYIGSTVGRCANRIGNSSFKINNKEYHVLANNGPNSLHGGGIQFSFEEFECVEKTDDKISFKYYSKNNDAGYPGNLTLLVSYRLDNNKLHFDISGISDEDTLFNITNHTYFNFNGGSVDALETQIKIPTDYVSINDENGMSKDIKIEVADTVYDFREFKKLKDIIGKDDSLANGGIDHNYVFENMDDKLICSLKDEKVQVNIYSDLPDAQIYSANCFDEFKARNGYIYNKYWGIAVEPQYCPNAINYEGYLKPIIKANQEAKHHIVYEII